MTLKESSHPFAACVSDFRNRRVLVLGDAILDEYILGDCRRISPEAPVPVLNVTAAKCALGGAANTAANVVSLGGHAVLIARVGDDGAGATLRHCAAEAGIQLLAVDSPSATLRKVRVVGRQQQIVRLDYEDTRALTPALESQIVALVESVIQTCDIVVVSDYAKGFLSASLTQAVIRRAHQTGREVIVDPRPQHREYYSGCDYLTPNWRESRALLGLGDAEPSPDEVMTTARALVTEFGAGVVLTLGARGITFSSRSGSEHFTMPTKAREVFDVSGAGDTVVAAFALARASGADHVTAVTLANEAAGVVVEKFGTATATADEILRGADALRVVPRHRLALLAATLRANGKRIVTVNGAFDVLHNGHLHILTEARGHGDVLIVGVNSDASIRQYKGPTRPIVAEQHRADMLLALRMVDYVHIFDEPDPIAFLTELAPDVHINGSEYGADCIESETVRQNGGTIVLVNRLPGLSTSGLVDALELR